MQIEELQSKLRSQEPIVELYSTNYKPHKVNDSKDGKGYILDCTYKSRVVTKKILDGWHCLVILGGVHESLNS